MTREKLKQVLQYYDKWLEDIGFPVNEDRNNWAYGAERLGYLRHMCRQVQSWDLDNLEEDWVKANRWLGFIQGVLWEHHIFTIDNMRDHNR